MAANEQSFLNVFQAAFDRALVEAYERGAEEKAILAAVGPTFARTRATAKSILLRELRRTAPRMLREHRRSIAGFEKRNFTRWRKAFDRFEMLIVIVEELGQEHDQALRPEAVQSRDYKFEALAHLLPRAVLIAREMLHLLRGGYPDAALSRWRSLYEMSVIASFIGNNEPGIALRYLGSFDFRALRAAREYNAHAARANLKPYSVNEIAYLEARAVEVEREIGERLKKDYDWAFPAISSRFPTLKPDKVDFTHIEQSVGMDHWRPRLRIANQHIHAGYRPHQTLLGMSETQQPAALIGPSNSGFVDPFQMGAISLVHVASTFLLAHPNLDRIINIDILGDIRDEIAEIAIRLERETLAAHRKGLEESKRP